MDYTIVIEKGIESYSGYPLDIEGIYAFGDSKAEVIRKLTKAIAERVAELRAAGKALPKRSHSVSKVRVKHRP
ncbi:MAG TPA: hypothetical protein VGR69_02545 [Candidatus Rubrimentiphilum sp.]|nr:hypothetical protein [Candidatus Rubrimentiphilum sp.]